MLSLIWIAATLLSFATSLVAADTLETYSGSQLTQFKGGAGTVVNFPLAKVVSRVTIEFDSLVCQASPSLDLPEERELCLDLSPTKCDVRCTNGTAYAIDDAVSFVTLFIVRSSMFCDKDGNTRLQCEHQNTEGNKMLLLCPRELANHLLIKSPFHVKSVIAASPEYPRSWVAPEWLGQSASILKDTTSVSLTNTGAYFELSGPDAFPVLMANPPKPNEEPPCHQNVFMAGVNATEGRGGGRLLAMSTTQHFDTRHEGLWSGAIAWLAGNAVVEETAVQLVNGLTSASGAASTKRVFVWRVPDFQAASTTTATEVGAIIAQLALRLTEGRGVLLFYGSGTRWPVVERFLDTNGLHFTQATVDESDRQITISSRIAGRLLRVYKSLRGILTDMAANELHWDRNPSWIQDKRILTRNCRDDYRLKYENPNEFQTLLGRALCNNRDIVSFFPCTFQPACEDNTCGAAVVSGRPCFNKVNHFGFVNQLLNFLTEPLPCLSQYDTAGVHPGPVRNLASRIGNYRVQLGKKASQGGRTLAWDPQLAAAGLAYGNEGGIRGDLISTGVYLPALTKARVRVVSAQPTGGRLKVTVGHNLDIMDGLSLYGERTCLTQPWLDKAQTYYLSSDLTQNTELFSPFGGLIHVHYRLPHRVTDYDAAEFKLELEFYNVVQAPYLDFQLVASPSGRTHVAEAMSADASPAPWGEFRSGFAILGTPRSAFSRVNGNTLLAMRFLERTARLSVLIGGPTFGHWRLQRQQRMNTDVDLQCYNIRCRGYSGNPLYFYVDFPSNRHYTDGPDGTLLDGASMLADRDPNSRDVLYHELGHNFSPVSSMFAVENREVAADFTLVLLRRYLHGLDLVNTPFLFNRKYNYKLPSDDASLCQSAASYDWTRTSSRGTILADLFPALIIIDHFGLNAFNEAQSRFLRLFAKEGVLDTQYRLRAASAVLSNVTGYNLQPIFAFFNCPIDPSLRTGKAGFDDLLARESRLPAFFPGNSWVAGCLPDRLRSIEQRFGGRLERGDGRVSMDGLFNQEYFTMESPHTFSRERMG